MANIDRSRRMAVVRVRGVNNVRKTIKDTCKLLNVAKMHNLSFVDDRAAYRGMLQRAKDWVTWGEVNEDTVTQVLTKWGRLPGNERLTDAYINHSSIYNGINGV